MQSQLQKKRNDLALLTAAFHVQQIFVSENSTEQIGILILKYDGRILKYVSNLVTAKLLHK